MKPIIFKTLPIPILTFLAPNPEIVKIVAALVGADVVAVRSRISS
jgi:hypothetical protein